MKKFDWLILINLPLLYLKILGLGSINSSSSWYYVYLTWRYFGCIIFGFCSVISETAYFLLVSNNLTSLTSALCTYSAKPATMVNFYTIIVKASMVQELTECLKCELFQPKSKKQKLLVEPRLMVCYKIFKIFYGLLFLIATCYSTLPLIKRSDSLPFAAIYPFNHKNPLLHKLLYVYQSVGFLYIGMLAMSTNMLISSLSLYIHAQLTILCNDLENLYLLKNCNKRLNQAIIHYQKILRFAKRSNNFLDSFLLVKFGLTITFTALIMFQMSVIKIFSSDFCPLLIFLIIALFEMFLVSWFGNEVQFQVIYSIFSNFVF